MAGNGRPIIPGQMAIETTFAPGPLAQPSVVTMNGRDGIKLLTIGGLSKVEALAGQIASGLVWTDKDSAFIVSDAVDIAEAILAECNRRVVAAQEPQAKNKIEGA